MIRLSLYPILGSYLLVLLLAAALVALLFLGLDRDQVAKRRRRILQGLRIAVILLLVWSMLRPTIVYTEARKLAATLVVLVDSSISMTVADEMNGRSRWEAVAGSLERAAPSIDRLQKDFEVKAYAFAGDLESVPVTRGSLAFDFDEPGGRESAIGHALGRVLDNEAGKRLLAVLLLSDGAQRAIAPRDELPQDAAARLRDAACPLYTLSVGKSRGLGQTQDVAVEDLLAPARVFVNNEMTIAGQVRIDGYVNRDIPLKLLYEVRPGEMEEVGATVVRASGAGELVPFEFQYIPSEAGEHKIVVQAPPQTGELVETNNEAAAFVQVLKGGLRVLMIEGTWRVEQKFLRMALDASPDIDVDYVRLDASHPETAPADLDARLMPGQYAVYVLGDVDSTAFTPSQLEQLAKTVAGGAGLIALGGRQAFGPGGYGATPLAAAMPIEMHPYERQKIDAPQRQDVHIPGPVRMVPTERGLRHFAMRLTPSAAGAREKWSMLQPLDGANRFSKTKPAAVVLAETQAGAPLLVSQSFGAGRVLAFAADSTWRAWWMQGEQEAHKRFWRQIILWLAKKDASLEGNAWIRLSQRSFPIETTVEFAVGAQGPSGELILDATGEAFVRTPSGEELRVPLTRQDGQLMGEFTQTSETGDYTIRAVLNDAGEPLGEASARFNVVARDLELDNAAADPRLLESIAEIAQGRMIAPEELPSLLEQLAESTKDLEEKTETKRTLWDLWSLLLLLATLLGVEWFLRKRWGLV